jgi:hypothetical protein
MNTAFYLTLATLIFIIGVGVLDILPMLGPVPVPVQVQVQVQAQQGGRPFSDINTHMGKGVPGSYADIPNGPDPTKQQYAAKKDQLLPTYYGHGIPLHTRAPGPFEGPPLTSHAFNPKCSPDCCPSPYSCDKGCLCVDIRGLGWQARAKAPALDKPGAIVEAEVQEEEGAPGPA